MLSFPDHAIPVFISHRDELIQSGLMSALDREEASCTRAAAPPAFAACWTARGNPTSWW